MFWYNTWGSLPRVLFAVAENHCAMFPYAILYNLALYLAALDILVESLSKRLSLDGSNGVGSMGGLKHQTANVRAFSSLQAFEA